MIISSESQRVGRRSCGMHPCGEEMVLCEVSWPLQESRKKDIAVVPVRLFL